MSRPLVYDSGHGENFGDRMVHEVVSAALRSRVPGLQFVRTTSGSVHGVAGYNQFCQDDWVELGNQCDMILILGGSVFYNDRVLALALTFWTNCKCRWSFGAACRTRGGCRPTRAASGSPVWRGNDAGVLPIPRGERGPPRPGAR